MWVSHTNIKDVTRSEGKGQRKREGAAAEEREAIAEGLKF